MQDSRFDINHSVPFTTNPPPPLTREQSPTMEEEDETNFSASSEDSSLPSSISSFILCVDETFVKVPSSLSSDSFPNYFHHRNTQIVEPPTTKRPLPPLPPCSSTYSKPASSSKSESAGYIATQRWTQILGWFNRNHILTTLFHPGRTPLERKLYSKILGRRVEVNQYRTDLVGEHEKACSRCGMGQLETIEHLFFHCRTAQVLWRSFEVKAREYGLSEFMSSTSISLRDVILFFPSAAEKITLMEMESDQQQLQQKLLLLTVMHSCALFCLWKSRTSTSMQTDGFVVEMFNGRVRARMEIIEREFNDAAAAEDQMVTDQNLQKTDGLRNSADHDSPMNYFLALLAQD